MKMTDSGMTGRGRCILLVASLWMLLGACTQISHLFAVTQPLDRPVDRQQQAIVSRMQAIVQPDLRDNLNSSLPTLRG